jgi:hypothetical protein
MLNTSIPPHCTAGTRQRGREQTSVNQGKAGLLAALLLSPDGTLIKLLEAPAHADLSLADLLDAVEAGLGSPAAVTMGGGVGRTNRPPTRSCVALFSNFDNYARYL